MGKKLKYDSYNGNTGTICEICSKLTARTPERHRLHLWRRSVVEIFNFEQVSHHCSGISIVDFEQVNAFWELGNLWLKCLASLATSVYLSNVNKKFWARCCLACYIDVNSKPKINLLSTVVNLIMLSSLHLSPLTNLMIILLTINLMKVKNNV